MKIIQPALSRLDVFYIIIYTFLCMMITKYEWFLKIIQPPLGGLDFYDFAITLSEVGWILIVHSYYLPIFIYGDY